MRALHLIDPAGPGGGACTLRLAADVLAAAPANGHAVLIIGNASHLELARRCGLRPRGRLGAPLNRPALALRALRGLLRGDERAGAPYDLLHAWTLTSAVAALRAGGRRVVVTTAAGAALGASDRRKLRRAEVLALGTGAARSLKLSGVGFAGMLQGAVAPGTIDFQERPLLRQSWGADETCLVVGLLSDPPGSADGEFAMSAVGRAALSGRDIRIVMHHGSAPPGGLRRWLKRLGLPHMVIIDDRIVEPWRVVAGLDAALHSPKKKGTDLFLGGRDWLSRALSIENKSVPFFAGRVATPATVLPLPWAMAARLPVVAARTDEVMELIDDGVSGLLFPAGLTNAASTLLLDLFDDAALRGGSGPRRPCADRMTPQAFATQLVDAYYGTKWGHTPVTRVRTRTPGVIFAEQR